MVVLHNSTPGDLGDPGGKQHNYNLNALGPLTALGGSYGQTGGGGCGGGGSSGASGPKPVFKQQTQAFLQFKNIWIWK